MATKYLRRNRNVRNLLEQIAGAIMLLNSLLDFLPHSALHYQLTTYVAEMAGYA